MFFLAQPHKGFDDFLIVATKAIPEFLTAPVSSPIEPNFDVIIGTWEITVSFNKLDIEMRFATEAKTQHFKCPGIFPIAGFGSAFNKEVLPVKTAATCPWMAMNEIPPEALAPTGIKQLGRNL